MKIRVFLAILLGLTVFGTLVVQAMAIPPQHPTFAEEYGITGAGNRYSSSAPVTPVATGNNSQTPAGSSDSGSAATSVYGASSGASLPVTGIAFFIPAAGFAATGIGGWLTRRRSK